MTAASLIAGNRSQSTPALHGSPTKSSLMSGSRTMGWTTTSSEFAFWDNFQSTMLARLFPDLTCFRRSNGGLIFNLTNQLSSELTLPDTVMTPLSYFHVRA